MNLVVEKCQIPQLKVKEKLRPTFCFSTSTTAIDVTTMAINFFKQKQKT